MDLTMSLNITYLFTQTFMIDEIIYSLILAA